MKSSGWILVFQGFFLTVFNRWRNHRSRQPWWETGHEYCCWWQPEIRLNSPVEVGSVFIPFFAGFYCIHPNGGWEWDFWTISTISTEGFILKCFQVGPQWCHEIGPNSKPISQHCKTTMLRHRVFYFRGGAQLGEQGDIDWRQIPSQQLGIDPQFLKEDVIHVGWIDRYMLVEKITTN